jgi:hypothetical protein
LTIPKFLDAINKFFRVPYQVSKQNHCNFSGVSRFTYDICKFYTKLKYKSRNIHIAIFLEPVYQIARKIE